MGLSFLVLFLFPTAFAADSAPPKAILKTVPKQVFIEQFKAGFPKHICKEKSFLRKCYNIAEDKCVKTSTDVLAGCITKLEAGMPAEIREPEDAKVWGEQLGTCLGAKYEIEFVKNKLTTAECKDVSKWKP